MKKDKKISLDEHLETADNMVVAVHHMNLIFGIIQKHYPMSHKLFVEVQKLRGRLSELRSLLDNEYHGIIDDATWEKHRNIYHSLGARYSTLSRLQKENITCKWKYDEWHNNWQTSCGHAHVFIADGPRQNNYKYCPYCGGKLEA